LFQQNEKDMSLLFGCALHTLESANQRSQHSLLMRFFEIEKELEAIDKVFSDQFDDYLENKISKKQYEIYKKVDKSKDLARLFMTVEAKSILLALNIL
jgi:hypothetical protein